MASTVSFRSTLTVPALLTRISSLGQRARSSAASRRIDACEAKVQSDSSTVRDPDRCRTYSEAAAVFAGLRPTSTTRAPRRARATAASRPRPLLAPVTTAVFPSRLSIKDAAQQGAGDRDRVVQERGQPSGRAQGVARDAELAQGGAEVEIHPLTDQRLALEFKDEGHAQADRAAGGGEAAPR